MPVDFPRLVDTLRDDQHYYVDHDAWREEWGDRWVAFADLIAFADRCKVSEATALNAVLRFHRAVNLACQSIQDYDRFQFTDACFVVSESPRTVAAFAANVQNECLGMNRILMDRNHAVFHHLILPRVTIAHGRVLRVEATEEEDRRLRGINASDLLAGAGVVKAYEVEKKTAGGLVSIAEDDAAEVQRLGCTTVRNRAASLYRTWRMDGQPGRFQHDGVLDMPWLVMQGRQRSKGAFLVESDEDLRSKCAAVIELLNIWFGTYLVERSPTVVAKHYGGLLRHLCEIVQEALGRGPRRWDLRDLAAAVEDGF